MPTPFAVACFRTHKITTGRGVLILSFSISANVGAPTEKQLQFAIILPPIEVETSVLSLAFGTNDIC